MELKTAKGRLFLLISLLMTLPMAEHLFGFIKSGNLQCESTQHPNIPFSITKWWDGSYQEHKTLYLNDSVGFRPDLVRLNNQIEFSIFKKMSGGDIMGYDGYIFGKEDVEEKEQISYMGTDVIRGICFKLKHIQDTLQKLGKTFVFAYAPSKAHLMPDKIPGRQIRKGLDMNNYSAFRRIGDSQGLRQLDFIEWFYSIKPTVAGPLMTRNGFHWSTYGSLQAAAYLVQFIEKERHIKMPELQITSVHYTDTPRGADDDLLKCTNLIFPTKKEQLAYPEYHYRSDSTTTKPRIVFIGDSFVWVWIADGFLKDATAGQLYWSYFGDVWDDKGTTDINSYDWQKAIAESDCVVTVFTPMNFHLFTKKNLFVEKMYNYYYPQKNN